ncbi:uncharacterized protein EMH_0022350 [Eimeria mitis]|uniref:Uncharacterized protein n=1 Tax=Eimeria mitis TaxID=44415 RepID=U6JVL3_9EIME|nr:uncharacterized protein EMH_0022350 [Eimeria mitis]CDJ29505.1 hypothetical protein, conserved [Eimeria mitis]
MFFRGAVQFKEALLNGNPVAVATVGIISFLVLTVAARCTYSLRSSASSTDHKKSTNRRRRKASGSVTSTPTKQAASPPVQTRKPPKKAECETEASSNASMAKTLEEAHSQEIDANQPQEDGGGDWFVVASKKKPRPKKA